MQSITKALLFVIALSTSIIAVELVSVSRVNKLKLLCAEYNSIDFNYKENEVAKFNPELNSTKAKMELLLGLRKEILTDENVNNEIKRLDKYCASL